jgi:hypothetical protein
MKKVKTFTHQGKTLTLSRAPAPETKSDSPFDGVTAGASSRGGLNVHAPGAGQISIDDLELSADQVSPGESVTLQAVVRGENIGHIFLDVLYHHIEGRTERYIGSLYRRYLVAETSHEVSGIYYPRWETENAVSCKYKPGLDLLADREERAALACFVPDRYNPDPEETEFTVDGRYTYAINNEQRRATLTFNSEGFLTKAVSFTETGLFASAPRPMRPAQGDRFEPFITIANPRDWQDEDLLADPVAVGAGLRRVVETPLPGAYRVGLLIKDHDSNSTRAYAHLEVSR